MKSNLPLFHQHRLAVDFIHRDRQLSFGFNFEKVVDISYSGLNLRAGQQMVIKVKPAGSAIPANEMLDQIYITMFSEQILEIRDLGPRVFD